MGHPHLSRLALRRRLIGLLGLGALALGGFMSPAAARPLDEVKSTGFLRVAVYRSLPPFSSVDEKGQPQGIDIDLGQALAKSLGVSVSYFLIRDGDEIADDLRNGVWRGTVVGEQPGDVMMHVPYDKRLEETNDLVRLVAPYHVDRLALAVDPAKEAEAADFGAFEKAYVGVDVGTLADMVLVSTRDKALVNNVRHFRGSKRAFEAYEKGELSGVYGPSSEIEPLVKTSKRPASLLYPKAKLARDWTIGLAVRINARDLGYALGDEIDRLRDSGELARIFARHGVTLKTPVREE